MIIVAGVKNFREAEWLFANGAGEVYCGITDIPNHRRDSLSLNSESELFRIVDLAKRKGKKTLLLLNQSWDPGEYGRLSEKVRKRVARGVDGLVIKDLPLIDYLHGREVKSAYILSSLAMAFNSHAVDLFGEYGIKRFILPYHLPPGEAAKIIKRRPRVETEIFYSPSHFCQNIDPLCKFCTWDPGFKACNISLKCGEGQFQMPYPDLVCKADIMFDAHKAGVKYLKIPRTLDFSGLKRFIKDAKELTSLLREGVSREGFRKRFTGVYSSDKV